MRISLTEVLLQSQMLSLPCIIFNILAWISNSPLQRVNISSTKNLFNTYTETVMCQVYGKKYT